MLPYIKLPIKCQVMEDLLRIIEIEEEFHMYREWWTRPIPDEIAAKDPFMKFLRWDLESRFGIMRADPWHAYKWHVDKKRQGTINMLIKGSGQCFFSPTLELRGPIRPLQYEVGNFYLFDTQEPHEVLNTSSERRYMFTTEILGVHKDKRINELKELIDELYIS